MQQAAQRGSHWEGWAQLDGLLSGPLPDASTGDALVASLAADPGPWPAATLDLDGGRFHLLMGDAPFEVPPGSGAQLAARFTEQLERWLGAAGIEASACESTVRLRRWSSGTEEQSLVVPDANGLQAMSREVEVATLAPPAVARWSRWRRWIEAGLLLAAAIIAWFVLRTVAPEAPAAWSDVAVELGPWEGLLLIERGEGYVALTRALSDEELRAAWLEAEPGTARAFALEDLARGRLRLRCFDEVGVAVGPAWQGLVLEEGETRLEGSLPPDCATVRLVP